MFNLKLASLLDNILINKIIGTVVAHLYVIEFQKRGLPHAHIVIILTNEDKPKTPEIINRIVSCELPGFQVDPHLHTQVQCHRIHGPCGTMNSHSPCTVDGICSKDYPKQFHLQTVAEVNGYLCTAGQIIEHMFDNTKLIMAGSCHTIHTFCASNIMIISTSKYVHQSRASSTFSSMCTKVIIVQTSRSGSLV